MSFEAMHTSPSHISCPFLTSEHKTSQITDSGLTSFIWKLIIMKKKTGFGVTEDFRMAMKFPAS